MELTIEEKEKRGKLIIEVFMLKRASNNPVRFRTMWGDKTALGVYETMSRLIERGE